MSELLSNAKTAKPRILLVEDDPISARLTSNLLAELEAEVTHVMKGEEALALMEGGAEYEVILMDLYLPGMNGFKTTEAILALDSQQHKATPIVALTSNPLMESKQKFLRDTGFTDYYTKPAKKDTFAAFVKKYLPPPKLSLDWY